MDYKTFVQAVPNWKHTSKQFLEKIFFQQCHNYGDSKESFKTLKKQKWKFLRTKFCRTQKPRIIPTILAAVPWQSNTMKFYPFQIQKIRIFFRSERSDPPFLWEIKWLNSSQNFLISSESPDFLNCVWTRCWKLLPELAEEKRIEIYVCHEFKGGLGKNCSKSQIFDLQCKVKGFVLVQNWFFSSIKWAKCPIRLIWGTQRARANICAMDRNSDDSLESLLD